MDTGVIGECVWTVKERHGKEWVPVLKKKNALTNYGLTGIASGFGGAYIPPLFLVIEQFFTTLGVNAGPSSTSFYTADQMPQGVVGSTLIVGYGLPTQEAVVMTVVSNLLTPGYGWYAAPATPFINTHYAGEYCIIAGSQQDTLASIVNEAQYDSINFPNQRPSLMAGYSGGVGNYVTQFLLTATQAPVYIAGAGLSDSLYIGAGNLHNHVTLGYDHTAGAYDIEIDANLTIANNF